LQGILLTVNENQFFCWESKLFNKCVNNLLRRHAVKV